MTDNIPTQAIHALSQNIPVYDISSQKKYEKAYKWTLTIDDKFSPKWERNITLVQIDRVPFAKGTVKSSFKMRDITQPEIAYVAKFSTNNRISRNGFFNFATMQAISDKCAERFNSAQQSTNKTAMKFTQLCVLELVERMPPNNVCVIELFEEGDYVEKVIDSTSEDYALCQAYNHYVLCKTNYDILMSNFVSAQGQFKNVQIHTKSGKGFLEKNLGHHEMLGFADAHKCNQICQRLKLPPIDAAQIRDVKIDDKKKPAASPALSKMAAAAASEKLSSPAMIQKKVAVVPPTNPVNSSTPPRLTRQPSFTLASAATAAATAAAAAAANAANKVESSSPTSTPTSASTPPVHFHPSPASSKPSATPPTSAPSTPTAAASAAVSAAPVPERSASPAPSTSGTATSAPVAVPNTLDKHKSDTVSTLPPSSPLIRRGMSAPKLNVPERNSPPVSSPKFTPSPAFIKQQPPQTSLAETTSAMKNAFPTAHPPAENSTTPRSAAAENATTPRSAAAAAAATSSSQTAANSLTDFFKSPRGEASRANAQEQAKTANPSAQTHEPGKPSSVSPKFESDHSKSSDKPKEEPLLQTAIERAIEEYDEFDELLEEDLIQVTYLEVQEINYEDYDDYDDDYDDDYEPFSLPPIPEKSPHPSILRKKDSPKKPNRVRWLDLADFEQELAASESGGGGEKPGLFVKGSETQSKDKAWDLKSFRTFELKGAQAECITSNENEPILYTGSSEGYISIWDLDSSKVTSSFKAHTKAIKSLVLDGPLLHTGSSDSYIATWDLNTKKLLNRNSGKAEIHAMCISVAHSLLFSAENDKSVKVWDLQSLQSVATLSGHTRAVKALCVVGNYLFSGSNDQQVFVWNLSTQRLVKTLVGHEGWIRTICAMGSTLYTGSQDETIRLWDMSSTDCFQVLQAKGPVQALLPTPQCLFSAAGDFVEVWNQGYECANALNNRSPVLCMHRKDNQVFCGSITSALKVWAWDNQA